MFAAQVQVSFRSTSVSIASYRIVVHLRLGVNVINYSETLVSNAYYASYLLEFLLQP